VKKLFKIIKLTAVVAVVAGTSFLAFYVYQPIKHASAEEDNLIPLTNLCDSVGGCENNPQNNCVDPETQECLPGCSRNSDEVCVEDTKPPVKDTVPQVLGVSTTSDPTTEAASGK
jgi:hypothetical protein